MVDFAIVPVIIIGLILGLLELIFIHQDEAGLGWLSRGLHAIPVMFVFVFISMNVDYVVGLIGVADSFWITLGVRVLVGIIAAIKISAAAAVAGRVGEKLPHTLTIAALIMIAPYEWTTVLCTIPFIQNIYPSMNGCPAIVG